MRLVVISDCHGETRNLYKVLSREANSHIIYLGDGISAFLETMEVFPNTTYDIVAGNCDFFAKINETQIKEFSGKKVLFTHGHRFSVKSDIQELEDYAKSKFVDIALFGHTHLPYCSYKNGLHLLNPGSISQPRMGKPSYGFVDITSAGVVTNIVYI